MMIRPVLASICQLLAPLIFLMIPACLIKLARPVRDIPALMTCKSPMLVLANGGYKDMFVPTERRIT